MRFVEVRCRARGGLERHLRTIEITEEPQSRAQIELEIGTLAGIEFDALDFVWASAVKNSVLDRAIKEIDIIEAKGQCVDCDTIFSMKNIFDACPECNSYLKGIIQGKELRVKALEVCY